MSEGTGKGASLELAVSRIEGELAVTPPGHQTVLLVLEDVACVLAALTPATEPPSAGREGWKLVPVEPTEDMMRAAQCGEAGIGWSAFSEAWADALAAAPSPEPQPSVRLEREVIARIIDPEAFRADPEMQPTADLRQAVVQRRNHARAKADAIISSARSGGE